MKEKLTRAEKKEEEIIMYQAEKLIAKRGIEAEGPMSDEDYRKRYLPEAILFVTNDPAHSMARKITKTAMVQVCRRGRVYDKLMASFTPEERAVWDEDMDYDGKFTGFRQARAGGCDDALKIIDLSPVKDKNKAKAKQKIKKMMEEEMENSD